MAAQQPPHEGTYADDEISLIDLWRVLARRKHWIAIAFVVTLALATVWLALKTPVYEGRATLEVGTVGEQGERGGIMASPLEDPKALTNRLLNQRPEGVGPGQEPVLTEVETEGRILNLTARATSQRAAEGFLREQIAAIQERHDGFLEEFRAEQHQRLDEVSRRLEELTAEQETFEQRLSQLGEDATAIGGLLTLEQRLSGRLPELEAEQAKLRRTLSERVTAPTSVLVAPEPQVAAGEEAGQASPVEPKNRLVLALAAVLGLMLGVFVAFFREFLARVAEAGEEEAE